MVEERKAQYGWEFLFLGANIDAIETAGRFGISPNRAVNYESDSMGTQLNYEVLSDTVSAVRRCTNASAKASMKQMDDEGDWSYAIKHDYASRHEGRSGRRGSGRRGSGGKKADTQ